MDPNNTWTYKHGDKTEPATASSQAAARLTSSNQDLRWTGPEYLSHERGAGWYFLLIVGSTILAAGVFFLSHKDKVATATVPLLAIVVAVFAQRKPREIGYQVSNSGVSIGTKSYPFSLFKSFSIIREGGFSSVNLQPIKRLMPALTLYFDPKQEEQVVNILGNRLPIEQRPLDPIERLSRRLRF